MSFVLHGLAAGPFPASDPDRRPEVDLPAFRATDNGIALQLQIG